MFEAIGLFLLGLVLLALGGDSIVKGASGLAQRFGASPLVAGLVLVAFGTSVPEIAVNLHAIAAGHPDLALGWAKFPDGMDLRAMIGMGLLCGIGFTMSLFIASLGYRDPVNYEGAVLGVLCASVIAALVGYGWLRVVLPAPGKTR